MFLVTIYEPSLLMSQVYKKDEQNVKLLATSAVMILITSYTHIISSHKLSYAGPL